MACAPVRRPARDFRDRRQFGILAPVGETQDQSPGSTRERVAWCTFDFANSAFPTIALTAFGGPYFVGVLVGPEGLSLGPLHVGPVSAWGLAISLSMVLVTITSPVMGAIADRSGKKRSLLAGYVAVCVAATVGLGFCAPGAGLAAFALYVLANFAFEGAYVFYNAFLPELTSADRIGRLSGYGWALGYGGGLFALVLCKPLVPATYDAEHAAGASNVFFLVAAWYLVFSLPALLVLRDRAVPSPPPEGYVRAALSQLARTAQGLRARKAILIFLVAYFLYNDALTTVIEFVGVFTKEALAFTPGDNVTLFLVLNVIAAPGAALFGFVLDRIGGKRALRITLVLWILVVIGAVLTHTRAMFWVVASLAAVVIGATQSSSRAFMAKLAPRDRTGEFMGLLALSGKASAVFGPILYGAVADVAADSSSPGAGHRMAIGVIGSFFVIAWFVLGRVDEAKALAAKEREEREERETGGRP